MHKIVTLRVFCGTKQRIFKLNQYDWKQNDKILSNEEEYIQKHSKK